MKTKWCVLAATGLSLLMAREAGASGACTAARFHDWNDMGCNQNYAGAGGPPAPPSCSTCGMPRWWVSEPYINLFMSDTPLSYTLSSGQEMAFRFYYHQRTKLPDADEVPGYWAYPRLASAWDNYPDSVNGATSGTNAFWGNNWTMSIQFWDSIWESTASPNYAPFTHTNYEAFVFQPEGGIDYYFATNSISALQNPKSQTRLQPLSNACFPLTTNTPSADANGVYWGDSNIGFKLVYPDGGQDVFSLNVYAVSNHSVSPNSTARVFLTQRIDPQGRITQIGYERIHYTNFWIYKSPGQYTYSYIGYRVRYVVDPDGRTNTFLYYTNTPTTRTDNIWQLAEIDDPYGRKTTLGYSFGDLINNNPIENTLGFLTSIVDAAGLTNSFQYLPGPLVTNTVYDFVQLKNVKLISQLPYSSGWITNLSTPYGNTSFSYYEVDDPIVTEDVQQRAIYVSEPTGAQQLYYYLHKGVDSSGNPLLVTTAQAPTVPGQTNFDDGNSGSTHPSLNYRNTIHWGRRQFAALSTNVQTLLPGSFSNALTYLTTNDFRKGRVRNWLWQSDALSISESLSSERDPSPDAAGQIEGARTWYNYPGKTLPELVGSSPQVSCVARLLPDSTSQYTTYNYYSLTGFPSPPAGAGLVSDNESSYSKPDGSVGVLTNWFHYAINSVDLLSVSNSAGQYVNYGYNSGHQITAATNALSQVTTLSWDGFTYNLTGVQLPAGKSISLSYNSPATPPTSTSAMLQQISISPEGRTFTVNNYSAGLPNNITDDRGLTVANTWDGLNRLTGTSFPDSTTISNVYSRLDLVASKDRLNNWTYYSFDGLQHLTTVTNANNAVTIYSYCGCGSLTAILDALTNLTTLNYDNQGNLTNVVFPDYSSLTYQYDLAGRMTNAFDGAGRYLQLAYNNQGLPLTITGANGILRQTIYDALNRPISVTDANGITVTNQFDAINELVKRTWPDGITEGYGYNAAGLIAYTNRDQKATIYGRDGAGRLIAETNANQEVTQFSYDSLNNVVSLIDGLQHQTTWQYNEYGWLTNKVDGLTRNALRYSYNANGWITNRWTPEKGNTGYTYDNVGNLKSIVYPQQTISYAYNALNQLTNMVDAVGTTVFSYTPAGQLASENGPWTSDTVTYTYVQGLRTALTLSQTSSNWSQSYGYDSSWRMTNVVSPAGAFAYSYNFQPASSLVTGIQLPNGANIVNSYDSLARLQETDLNNYWGHTLDGYSYNFDALGLRTNITRNLGLTTSTVSASYDAINQLTGWTAKEASGTARLNEQLGYVYDAAHNLHTRNNGILVQTFNTDAANQLTSVTRTGTYTVSGATPAPAASVTVNGQAAQTYGDFTFASTNNTLGNGTNTFAIVAQNVYGVRVTNNLILNLPTGVTLASDNNGNLTNDGIKVMSYNSENQLTNVTVPSSIRKDFVFDGLNRLRIKREYSWSGTAWIKTNEIRLVWDRNNIVQLRDSNNVPMLTLTRGLDLSGSLQGAGGIGGLLAMTEASGASSYYHNDALGNVTALMDAQENIVARRTYDAFLRTVNLTGTKTGLNPFWASSQLHDVATDIYSYLHRPYTPSIPARWLSADPAGLAGGINPYGFVGNNPVNFVDPLGLLGVFIAGSNLTHPNNPTEFLEIARENAWAYREATGDNAIVVQAVNLNDWQRALNHQDIHVLDYFGHADEADLNYALHHSLTAGDLAKLDFSNLSPNAHIGLYGCHTAGMPGNTFSGSKPENSIAQAFANAAKRPVEGIYGGLSFGLPLRYSSDTRDPNNGDSVLHGVELFPAWMRPEVGSQSVITFYPKK